MSLNEEVVDMQDLGEKITSYYYFHMELLKYVLYENKRLKVWNLEDQGFNT